jgi:lipoprotein-anchoring transpeptidase ErfK/SrfK
VPTIENVKDVETSPTSDSGVVLRRRQLGRNWVRFGLLAVFVVIAVIGAAQLAVPPRCAGGGCTRSSSSREAQAPAQVIIMPGPNARNVDPVAHVLVAAKSGTLADVRMVNDAGKPIEGVMTPDNTVWKPTVRPLGYGRTYTLTIASRGPGGVPHTQVSSFSTLQPSNQTKVSFTTMSEAPLQEGGTYGVGIVIVARFDEQISDRAAAERQLTVTTNPPVQGSWYWVGQTAHWRPEHYYAPGTTVTAEAKIYGISFGNGLFGQEDTRVSFRIGAAHISIADDATKQVSVYKNGARVRTMPTSMGMGGTATIAGQTLSFWTPPGIYTVLDKDNPVVMDSSTFGLPKNSRLGYREIINYATRISSDGIYMHELDSTVWAQGNTDTSHGCLNLNADNAKWFYDFSVPGDVVEVRNTGGPPLQLGQNGDWTIPWSQWTKGSALKRSG